MCNVGSSYMCKPNKTDSLIFKSDWVGLCFAMKNYTCLTTTKAFYMVLHHAYLYTLCKTIPLFRTLYNNLSSIPMQSECFF